MCRPAHRSTRWSQFQCDHMRSEMPGTGLRICGPVRPTTLIWRAYHRLVKVADRARQAGTASLSARDWKQFVADPSPSVRRALAARRDVPSWVLERLAGDGDRQTRQAVVGNPGCPPELLLACLGDADRQIRWDAVQHPNADRAVRQAAVRSPDRETRWAAAQLRDLEPDLIQAVIADPDWQVREQLATSTHSASVLEAAMQDPDARVRGEVALNELATENQLRRLAGDSNAAARAKVAARDLLPDDVQRRLAEDRSGTVRWWLCVSHDRDVALMRRMVADPDELVASHAMTALEELTRDG